MSYRAYLAHYVEPLIIEPAHVVVVAPDVVHIVEAAVIQVVAPDAHRAIRIDDETIIQIVVPDALAFAGFLYPEAMYGTGAVHLLSPGTLERPADVDPFVPEVDPQPPVDDEIEVPLPPWIPDEEYRP